MYWWWCSGISLGTSGFCVSSVFLVARETEYSRHTTREVFVEQAIVWTELGYSFFCIMHTSAISVKVHSGQCEAVCGSGKARGW